MHDSLVRDKLLLKSVDKFGAMLDELLKADPENDKEKEGDKESDKDKDKDAEVKEEEQEEDALATTLNATKANKRRLLFNHSTTTMLSPAVAMARGESNEIQSGTSSDNVFLSPKPPTPIGKHRRASAASSVTQVKDSSSEDDDDEEVIVASGNLRKKNLLAQLKDQGRIQIMGFPAEGP